MNNINDNHFSYGKSDTLTNYINTNRHIDTMAAITKFISIIGDVQELDGPRSSYRDIYYGKVEDSVYANGVIAYIKYYIMKNYAAFRKTKIVIMVENMLFRYKGSWLYKELDEETKDLIEFECDRHPLFIYKICKDISDWKVLEFVNTKSARKTA